MENNSPFLEATKVSIGILTYKRTDLLIDTLKDILTIKTPINLIIINNNEDIDVLTDIQSVISSNPLISLSYVWDQQNYGVSEGRNKILENLHTPFLIIFDDDVSIPDINQIVTSTITTLENDKNIGGLALHIKDNQTKKANRYEIPHKNKDINLQEDFDTYLFIGAGHAIRKDVIQKTNGYPKDFGLYGMEEIDLAFRIIGHGYKIRFLANSIIFHKRSPSGRHSNDYVYYLSFINRCKISIRYLQWKYICSTVLVRGLYMLMKTKKLSYIKMAIADLQKEISKRDQKILFPNQFYTYIKNVKGFLWW